MFWWKWWGSWTRIKYYGREWIYWVIWKRGLKCLHRCWKSWNTDEAPRWGTLNNNERRPIANNFISTLWSDRRSTIAISVHIRHVPPLHRRADGLHREAALWAAAGHRGSNGRGRGQHSTRVCNSGRVGLCSAGLNQSESDSPPGGGPASTSQALLCSLLRITVGAALHRGSVQEPLRGQDFHSAQHSSEAARGRQEVRGLDGQLCRETGGADWWLHRQRKHHLPHYKTSKGSRGNWGLSDSLDVIDYMVAGWVSQPRNCFCFSWEEVEFRSSSQGKGSPSSKQCRTLTYAGTTGVHHQLLCRFWLKLLHNVQKNKQDSIWTKTGESMIYLSCQIVTSQCRNRNCRSRPAGKKERESLKNRSAAK